MNRNFLLLFLILSILIPHQNSLAEWTEVVTNKAGNTYVDLDNIKKVDDFVFFWAVTDFLKPLENQYFSSKVMKNITFFARDVLERKSEKTKIAWPKNARPKML